MILENYSVAVPRAIFSNEIARQLPTTRPTLTAGNDLPAALAEPDRDETLAARVGQMLLGLRLHETGHRRHALMAAASIDRKLAALSVAESCARARRAADRVVARELLKLQIDEQRYDQATDSGRKQGAVLQMQRDLPHRRETMCDRRVGCPER